MKTNIKRIIISLIILLAGILLNNTNSMAYTYNTDGLRLNGEYFFNLPREENNDNVFCAEKNERLWTSGADYRLISHVSIKNDVATAEGKSLQIADKYNLRIATAINILNTGGNPSQLQKYMWGHLDDWVRTIGYRFGIDRDFASAIANENYEDSYETTVNRKAEEYGKQIEQPKDITSRDDIEVKVKTNQNSGKKYLRIGPYKISNLSTGLTNLKIYDANGETLSGTRVLIYERNERGENTEKWINVDEKNQHNEEIEIRDNKNFYICIPTDTAIEKISKITAKTAYQKTTVTADLYFFKCIDSHGNLTAARWQNLVVTDGNCEQKLENVNLTLPGIDLPDGELQVIKEDAQTTQRVANAEFTICRFSVSEDGNWYKTSKENGYYTKTRNLATDRNTKYKREFIRQTSTGTIKYQEENDTSMYDYGTAHTSYRFKTGTDGKIEIKNLKVGDYLAVEIVAPEGYKLKEGIISLGKVISAIVTQAPIIPNEPKDGELTIIKEDPYKKDGETQYVDGATFVIWTYEQETREGKTGKWYKIDEQTYVTSDDSRYETQVQDKTTTYNRKYVGNYDPNGDGNLIFGQWKIGMEKAVQDTNFHFITKNGGKIKISNLKVGQYFAKEIIAPEGYELIPGVIQLGEVVENRPTEKIVTEIPTPADINLVKVDEDNNEIVLNGAQFKFRHSTRGYLVIQNGEISFTDDFNSATSFETGINGQTEGDGKIYLAGVPSGEYQAYEVVVPEGYEVTSEGPTTFVVRNTVTSPYMVKNKLKYISLTGYVWVDKENPDKSNTTQRFDNLYTADRDALVQNVIVKLVDSNGNIVVNQEGVQCVQITGVDGSYTFSELLPTEVENYHVEFEYNALKYEPVTPSTYTQLEDGSKQEIPNGSKAIERTSERETFNNGFSSVEANTNTSSITKDQNGNTVNTLNYTISENEGQEIATLQEANFGADNVNEISSNGSTSIFAIKAYTSETDYKITPNGTPKIENINLGLKLRERPDISLSEDLAYVVAQINGYGHTYEYNKRFEHLFDENNTPKYSGGIDNLGLKYQELYNEPQSYRRTVYKSDYEFTYPENSSKELKLSMIYAVRLVNESISNLTTKINSIVTYFDKNYQLVAAGRELETTNSPDSAAIYGVKKQIEIGQTEQANNDYNKALLNNLNSQIEQNKTDTIYLQFELNKTALQTKLAGNTSANLNNISEVYSYATYKDQKIYAGVDTDSNPGNVDINNVKYQDDTSRAPELTLEISDEARKMTGTVFIDNNINGQDLQKGQERKGNGIYDEGEAGVPEIPVTLTENSGTQKVYNANTNAEGNFEITGYIPGDYTLTYTWGGQRYTLNSNQYTITVQDYKGTIFNKEAHQGNMWYKTNPEQRYTDATDNYQTRLEIDEEIKNKIKEENPTYTQNTMVSTSPAMGIGVEIETTSTGDSYEQTIKNLDFGIIERPKQEIKLIKRVSNVKVTLQNKNVIIDANIDEDGKVTGEHKYLTYIPQSGAEGSTVSAMVRMEMDSELLQGATLQVEYTIKVENNSEIDYVIAKEGETIKGANYYLYGDTTGETLLTMSPTKITDFLDKEWAYETPINSTHWDVQESESEIQEFVTEDLSTTKIEPGRNTQITMVVSKLLASSDKDVQLKNEAEITDLEKVSGTDILLSTPGNYEPGLTRALELDEFVAEQVVITPNTGHNKEYIIPVAIGLGVLAILGTGVVIIKKKVLKTK